MAANNTVRSAPTGQTRPLPDEAGSHKPQKPGVWGRLAGQTRVMVRTRHASKRSDPRAKGKKLVFPADESKVSPFGKAGASWAAARHSMGERIKKAATARKMTLRALSAKTGIAYSTLLGYLGGKHEMPVLALANIAYTLDVTADWIIFGPRKKLDEVVIKNILNTYKLIERLNLKEPISLEAWIASMYGYSLTDQLAPEPGFNVLATSGERLLALLAAAQAPGDAEPK